MNEQNTLHTESLKDTLGRALRDLRISITDRCNFRCTYCMPKEIFGRGYRFLPQDAVLTYEEITRLVNIFASLGTRKLRLTGGEPFMRRELETLVAMLAEVPGIEDMAITTNGSFPTERIASIKAAGVRRMTVSLDALDDETFMQMNDMHVPVSRVINWIDAAIDEGFTPLKINMVVKRGVNEHSILPMARFFNRPETILRYIEFMDVGSSNGWRMDDVVPAKEILQMVNQEMPIEAIPPNYPGEVANRFRYRDTGNEIGVIASVTMPFCRGCTRARLSANGSLYTCLFTAEGFDLKELLRSGASDVEITQAITNLWKNRTDRYSELRSEETVDLPKVEMSFIGG
ncbi:MAG: GTP 3',8-cyclase MoaA [Gammaproteobacteria bacterium]|nr:GTP 3',8-cyclase MoaA [Gammaproteobacteria bacterium]